jgi:hypothetical protein
MNSCRGSTGFCRVRQAISLHVVVSAAAMLVVMNIAACTPPASSPDKTEAQSPSKAADAGLPTRVEPQPLKCKGVGYSATYSAQTRSLPARVDVTFRGRKPTSAAAEKAVRGCLAEVAESKFLTSDVVAGTAWWSATGKDDDDAVVAFIDGSTQLEMNAQTKAVVTEMQREGATTSQSDSSDRSYFTDYTQHKRSVPPHDTWASVDVVFFKEPTEKRVYEVLISELQRVVEQSADHRIETTVFAHVGTKEDQAGRRQIKGSDGPYISVEYNPKRGPQITTGHGKLLGPTAVIRGHTAK